MIGEPTWKRAIKSARQQVTGILWRDRIADAGSLSTHAEAGGEQPTSAIKTGLNDLPLEISHMVMDQLNDIRDFHSLRVVSRDIRNVVDSSPATAGFYTAAKEGRSLAEDIHNAMYPKKGLSNVTANYSHTNGQAGLPVSADEYTEALGPTLRYLHPADRSKVVKDVRRLTKPATSIANIAKHVDVNDVIPLARDALKIFGANKLDNEATRVAAARALVRLGDRMDNTPSLEKEGDSLSDKYFNLIDKKPALANVMDAVRADEDNRPAPTHTANGNVMEELRGRFTGALNDKTISAQQRMKIVGPVATSIREEIDTRRAELVNRLREPPGRG